jgi:methyl coenzyme M reductase subunit D
MSTSIKIKNGGVEKKYRKVIGETYDEALADFAELFETVDEINANRLLSDLAVFVGINVKGEEGELEEIKNRKEKLDEKLGKIIDLAKNLKENIAVIRRNGEALSRGFKLRKKLEKISRGEKG